jgi:hypothetical protein
MNTDLLSRLSRVLLVFCLICLQMRSIAQTRKTENLVIITLDGMRWQEIFSGTDTIILNNSSYTKDADNLNEHFDGPTPADKRKKLLPFLWSVIANKGQIYGNRSFQNFANVANPYKISYPGYNEILTGFPDPDLKVNDKVPNKNITVLEYLNKQPGFAGKVAAFATWDRFPFILNEGRSGIFVNADDDTLSWKSINGRSLNTLNRISPRPLGCRPDLITYLYAKQYLLDKHPRVLMLSFLETDYAAHNGMYDLYVASAHAEDAMISDLWATLQSIPQYRNKTTLLITCDHGRGDAITEPWTDHGSLASSGGTWLAVMGPDTPERGELKIPGQIYQKQLAPTIAALLGQTFSPKDSTVRPIATVFR